MGNSISNDKEQLNVISSETAGMAGGLAELSAFGELLGKSLKMYELLFKKVVTLALISALAVFPLMLFIFSFGFFASSSTSAKIVAGILLVAALIFLIYIAVVTQVATLFLLDDGSRSVGEYFKKGMNVAWKAIVVSLLTGLLTLLWTLLLIIPGLVFSVYYSFSIYALIYENQAGMAAIKRSFALVKNYWWAVVSRTVFLSLIYLAAFAVVSLPIYFLPENSALAIFWNMVLSALRFITSPIFAIFSYLIFKELVNIKGPYLNDATQKTA